MKSSDKKPIEEIKKDISEIEESFRSQAKAIDDKKKTLAELEGEHYKRIDEYNRIRNREYGFKSFLWSTISIIIMLTIGGIIFALTNESKMVFSSRELENIEVALVNGADLELVKYLYNKKEIEPSILLYLRSEAYYPAAMTFNEALNELLAIHYVSGKPNPEYLKKVRGIMDEYNKVNPFDKLESNQKYLFENVRVKLDTAYSIVQPEVNNIADELNYQNVLVTKYLDKSNLSFWISISAFVISTLLSIIQIYQARIGRRVDKKLKTEVVAVEDTKEAPVVPSV